jgi:site-specific recombinase XerD
MLLDSAVTELLLAKDYTRQTRQRREYALREFVAWCGEQGVTKTEEVNAGVVRRYLAHLRDRPNQRWGEHLAGETQHSRAAIVRTFLRFGARDGWVDERAARYMEMPKRPQKVVQVLTRRHYALLLTAADTCYVRWLRLRDRALLALLFDTGVRASEACTLALDAVHIAPGEAYIRVEGKGRKQREIGVGRQASLALYRYLHRARPALTHGCVFAGRDGGPMTPNGVDKVLYRLRDVAGAEHFAGIRVSAHTVRHSFAVHFMEQGGDLLKLSRLMGHQSIHTTERYLRAYQARDARQSSASVLDNL